MFRKLSRSPPQWQLQNSHLENCLHLFHQSGAHFLPTRVLFIKTKFDENRWTRFKVMASVVKKVR